MDITGIKTRLERKFKGVSLDDVQGISDYTIFGEAANNLLMEIDPLETQRIGSINLFQDVLDYSPPSDLKGKKIIDIRPQTERSSIENWRQTYAEDLDRDRPEEEFSVEFRDGSKILRVVKSLTKSIQVTTVDDATLWTAGTGVSSIAVDNILFAEQGKSLRFNVSSGTNLITWADTAVDLDDHELKSSLFMQVYWPDSSIITSIKIRIGSSASDYYEITGTVHFGSKRTGWNLYRFDWNGATETGTVDEENVDYVRFEITTTSADTDIRIGRLMSRLPHPHEILYYSNSLFRSTGGTFLTVPTADTDLVNLENDAEQLFIDECCLHISEDTEREDEAQKYRNRLYGTGQQVGNYSRYKTDKPEEAIRPQTQYYKAFQRTSGR